MVNHMANKKIRKQALCFCFVLSYSTEVCVMSLSMAGIKSAMTDWFVRGNEVRS